MRDEPLAAQVLHHVDTIDSLAHEKAVESGRDHPILRDGVQKPSSREVLMPVLAGAWAVGHWTDRPRLAKLARRGLLAVLLATATAKTAKRIVCRARPNQGGDPTDWGAADGKRASFPSGHATDVSALATAIGLSEGASPLTAVGIGAVAVVGWSSLASERHWATDLLAGVAIGITAGTVAGAIDERVMGRGQRPPTPPAPTPPDRPARGAGAP